MNIEDLTILTNVTTNLDKFYLFERQLGDQFHNISNPFAITSVESVFLYAGALMAFIFCIPCMLQNFLQCIVCKTIKTVPCLAYNILTCYCYPCRKLRSKTTKIDNSELNIKENSNPSLNNDKTQLLITA
jgi:hypothetical protein